MRAIVPCISVVLAGAIVSTNALPAAPATGPLRVHPDNPRYFADRAGRAVYLTGSHTWNNLLDSAPIGKPLRTFDYDAYLDLLQPRHHNFIRMRAWEAGENQSYYEPVPYARTASGKYDLHQFNPAYFDRLRSRVAAARERGVYVSVMLFQGWSIYSHGYGNPWPLHPFNAANNVNGINGDADGDGEGKEVHSLKVPAVTRLQEAYLRKVVDTVNDLDNVLYEVTNETAISAAKGELAVEWIEPATGKMVNGGATPGGARREFKAPFAGPSVLDLKAK